MVRKELFLGLVGVLLLAGLVAAHEVYVLDEGTVRTGFGVRGINVLNALDEPGAAMLFTTSALAGVALFTLLSYLVHTKLSKHLDARFAAMRRYAHLTVRLGLGTALLLGALQGAVFGPDIPLHTMPGGEHWAPLLIATGVFLIFGALTRFAALVGAAAYLLAFMSAGIEMITYIHYFSILLVLLIERAELYSIDRLIGWKSGLFHSKLPDWFARLQEFGERYSFAILRVGFGIALLWAAISIKVMHPALPLEVVSEYGLDTIFGFAALIIVLGAAIIEILLGALIALGVLLRTALIALMLVVGTSVWFFGEDVWSHILLLALALGLFLHGKDEYTLDDKIYGWVWGWTKRFRRSKNPLSPQ